MAYFLPLAGPLALPDGFAVRIRNRHFVNGNIEPSAGVPSGR